MDDLIGLKVQSSFNDPRRIRQDLVDIRLLIENNYDKIDRKLIMLSNEEKKEILKDARSKKRRADFRAAKNGDTKRESFDEYIFFLNSIQRIFKPFIISMQPTSTRCNKL